MTDHTDPIRLVLSLEQLRDPIIKAMGQQMSLKDRELAIANQEIADLRKQLTGKGIVPIETLPKAQPPPAPPKPPAPKPEKIQSKYTSWVLQLLEQHGPMTVKELASRHNSSLGSAQQLLSINRAMVEKTTGRPPIYSLKAAAATAKP